MALLTIPFSFPLNVSVGVGDTAYAAPDSFNISGQSGAHQHSQDSVVEIGTIIEVQPNVVNGESFIVVDDADTIPNFSSSFGPPNNSFIMFSKDNKVNLSNILGYYAKVKMVNNSTIKSELFGVSAEATESSK